MPNEGGSGLAPHLLVDRGVITSANELFEAGHLPGVVALVSEALDHDSECVPLLVLRARANVALHRDLEAQADLRDIIRLDPQCALAYRLLGELATRRGEDESAAIFLREAQRLDPSSSSIAKLPLRQMPVPRFARGTHPPERESDTVDEGRRTVERFARGSNANPTWRTPAPSRHTPTPAPLPPAPEGPRHTLAGRPPAPPPSIPAPAMRPSRPPMRTPSTRSMRAPMPELPGFGEYLVASGILTRERLRAAQAYQRSMKVQLSTAIVTLGLATPQRIEWAAVAHQSQLASAQR